MKLSILVILIALTACADPITVYKPVTVAVPVPCAATAVSRPDWAMNAVTPDASLFEKVRAALTELQQRAAYEARLEAAAAACNQASI